MDTTHISIGDSTRGYTTAAIKKCPGGKMQIVKGTVRGYKYLALSAVASINRGEVPPSATTSGGDQLPVEQS